MNFIDELPNYVCGGYQHLVLKDDDGNVWTLGSNNDGRLGHKKKKSGGSSSHSSFPKKLKVDGAEFIRSISSKGGHTILLADNGKVFTFGYNGFGELGHDGIGHSIGYPKEVESLTKICHKNKEKIIKIFSCYTSFFITDKKNVYCAGYNNYGQCGLGHFKNINSVVHINDPLFLQKNFKIKLIALRDAHAMILTYNGDCYVSGNNSYGELSLPDSGQKVNRFKKVNFPNNEFIVNVSSGYYHSLFVTRSGLVYASGRNRDGELGLGDNVNRNKCEEIKYLKERNVFIERAECGYYFSVVMSKNKQDIYTFGSNSVNQLGVNEKTLEFNKNGYKSNVPMLVNRKLWGLDNWKSEIVDFTCGSAFCIVCLENGKLLGVGNNKSGALGRGHFENCNGEWEEMKFKLKVSKRNTGSAYIFMTKLYEKIANINFVDISVKIL